MSSAVARPRTDVANMGDHVAIEMVPESAAGRRKTRRRKSRRGGFRTQDVNTASPVPPTGVAGPLGGRRKTRKGKKHSRRH
jgi:hypothetical protein